MKKSIRGWFFLVVLPGTCVGQGPILFSNPTASATPGSLYDPLSGVEIPASLSPGDSLENLSSLDCSMGHFIFSNVAVPTRLSSADGPLAGPGIWAHMLLGETPDSLLPVGSPKEHFGYGGVAGGNIFVPGKAEEEPWPFVQMLAWDGIAWGTELAGVPLDQFGKTDVVQVPLISVCRSVPPQAPPFTQPAIVPPIPEPSTWVLGLVGGGLLLLRAFGRGRPHCR